MKNRIALVLLLGLAILAGFGCQRQAPTPVDPSVINRDQILLDARKNGLIMDAKETQALSDSSVVQSIEGKIPVNIGALLKKDFSGWKSAALADVTGGGSFGLAFMTREDGSSIVVAKMGNLPTAPEGAHYEGWLVHRGDTLRAVDTGGVTVQGDQVINAFQSAEDLSDFNFYLLTLEASDNNATPGTHVLEGILK
ncbi:anti-sigma factor [Candidatus Uhrbacteria bacterium]|nr:anti-sigma factor [Candidatus Uhrbacteria bacterium]